MEDLFFWWSVVSSLLALGFLCWDIVQLVERRRDKEVNDLEKQRHKAQVKVWSHHANGIQSGLFAGFVGNLSSVEDAKVVMQAMQQDARSLHESLNEERLFSEEEVKARLLQKESETRERLSAFNKSSPPTT